MSSDDPVLEHDMKNVPLYQQIADSLAKKIQTGMLRDGDRLPSESELMEAFHVSQITSKRALNKLAHDGYAIRIQGKGSFVHATGLHHTSPLIGVLFTTLRTAVDKELLNQLEQTCQKEGIRVLFGLSRESVEEENRLIGTFLDSGVEGLIIFPTVSENYNNGIVKLSLDHFPLVLIDRYFLKMAIPSVTANNYDGGYQLAKLFADGPCRRLSFITTAEANTATIDRQQGIEAALTSAGLPIDKSLWLAVPADISDGTTITEFLDTTKPDCIISVNAHLAGLVSGYAKRNHIRHYTFDTPDGCDYYIHQDLPGIAQTAVHILKNAINGRHVDAHTVTVPITVRKGDNAGV